VLTAALQQAREARLQILEVMRAAIPESRSEVAETAPKITTIHIPLDKVGEVIGPKGKVINTIQQETGADIGVDDDGARGIVTIGAVEAWRMEEAKAAILAIVDPPKAELGATYMGRVVNITKFGAFVNILPGRDGLVHISKLGGGKRINAVEDVLELGQEIEVRVDEIDDKGKVSLLPVGEVGGSGGSGSSGGDDRQGDGRPRGGGSGDGREASSGGRDSGTGSQGGTDVIEVSFEDSFDAELADDLGDLGPKSDRTDRGGDRGRRNSGGGGRRRHR
jgi:polyribonucleotide nucleotidyltransferase